CMTTWWTSNYW
nr:immunoglobulin heavy chain junction region [Macaca mulatta]MOW18829.1 immunoglobulin heavy chain junction region [Macaca mulatta]MOW18848.1 immunoglobulin heavy chain junction region [Macaca mulatta]MOW18856.1 immunoglobulin heavy chain junction region [Macaca mulatta]MOW18873.1 immunoglobulin heavy chain junction region [Macaca mulatta]